MTIEINPMFSVGPPTPECQLTCQNGGYCNYVSSNESTLLRIFVDGGMIEQCVCPPEYTGLTCENTAEQCHDSKCRNGTPCSFTNGKPLCDCMEADLVSTFAGDMCREPATSYCGKGGLQSKGFCTNGGSCKANLSTNSGGLIENEYSAHGGCHCPAEFEGPHCEYLKGRMPNTSEQLHLKITPAQGSKVMAPQSSGTFANVGIILGIVTSIFGVVGVAILAHHRRRSRRDRHYRDVLDRACCKDETPIQVKIMGDLEIHEQGVGGYVDDEDLHSISECSLEEIELEDTDVATNYRGYLQNIRDGGYEDYFDYNPDLSNIIGSLVNEEQH